MGSFVHKIDTWNLEAISCCKWESPFQIFTWHLTFDFLSHHNFWLICSISTKWDRFSNFSSQIIDIVVFICVICSGSYYRETVTAEWTDFVAMTGFWFSGVLLVFYLVHVIEKFHVIPWVTIELGFCGLWTFFYFTCALDLAVQASKYSVSAFAAASFFSFVAIGIYGFDAFLKFKAFKAGQLAQGERVVQQSESVTAYWKKKSPRYQFISWWRPKIWSSLLSIKMIFMKRTKIICTYCVLVRLSDCRMDYELLPLYLQPTS